MANLNSPSPRLAANQTLRPLSGESLTPARALGRIERLACFAGETKRCACFADNSNAAPAFRAETQADFRYTSIQGAVPKW
jgi:hypothetical protein